MLWIFNVIAADNPQILLSTATLIPVDRDIWGVSSCDLHGIGVAADISEADISKSLHIKAKLSAVLDTCESR